MKNKIGFFCLDNIASFKNGRLTDMEEAVPFKDYK